MMFKKKIFTSQWHLALIGLVNIAASIILTHKGDFSNGLVCLIVGIGIGLYAETRVINDKLDKLLSRTQKKDD